MKTFLPLRECEHCKELFRPTRFWQRFCQPAHRTAHYWETHAVVLTNKSNDDTFDPLVEKEGNGI